MNKAYQEKKIEMTVDNICSVKTIDKYERFYGLFSALITMAILVIALAYGQMLGGKYVFIKEDSYIQCTSLTHLFITKLLEGSNIYYSFKAGLGMNTSLLFAFEVFGPFNLLYLFSNSDNINTIYIIIMILKAGLAAFSFQLFARYNLKAKGWSSILFSVGYALVSYGIYSSDMTPLYDGIYFLPLILIAIKSMVDNKKAIWLTFLYTVLFVSNFYSGYIVGLASFVYLVVYVVWGTNNKEKKIKIAIRYFMSVLCSFLLSGFIIAPTLYEALKQGVVEKSYDFRIVPIWDMVSYLFPFHECRFFSMSPYYYCGIPAVLLIGAFFFNSGIKRVYKILAGGVFVVFGLSMMVRPLYAAAHMFNDPTGYTFRYAYILSFVLCSMGIVALKHIDGINKKKTAVLDLILVSLFLVAPFANGILGLEDNSPSFLYYIIAVILVAVWIIVFYLYYIKKEDAHNAKKNEVVILALFLLAVELCLNSYVLFASQPRMGVDEYEYQIQQANVLTSDLKEVDDSFYRVHYDGLANSNQSGLYDYCGSTFCSTTSNDSLKDFLYRIGISCTEFYITGNGSTELSKILLDEKYDLVAYGEYAEGNENYIIENETVGFGFMVDDSVKEVVTGGNVFENQNRVYSSLTGIDEGPFDIYGGDVFFEGENVSLYSGDAGEVIFSLEEEADYGYVKIKIPTSDDKVMYSWLSAGYNEIHPQSPIIYSPSNGVPCDLSNHMLMAPHIMKMTREDDYYVTYVYLTKGAVQEALITEGFFATSDSSYVENVRSKLQGQAMNITSYEDGHIAGNITAKEPGVCFISVPYEEGWTAIVDGEIKEIIPIFDDSFIGIQLDSGYHEVELIFEAPYSALGKMCSIIGIGLFAIILIYDWVGRRKGARI